VFQIIKTRSIWTVLAAALLTALLIACGGETEPTPSPASVLITVNPEENPAGFLRALPGEEHECLERRTSKSLSQEITRAK